MRYLVGFVCLLALAALPRSASAQVEAVISEPTIEEAAPTSETAAQEPTAKLEIDEAGVQVDASPPRRPDGYTLEEMKLRVKRARIGLLSTTGVFVASGLLWMWFVLADCGILNGECAGLGGAAAVMSVGGGTGMLVTGILLGVRKRKQRRLAQTQYGPQRRVQWDLARSRLVF